jgi:2-amino-4-hydroxy-6-hydroxymethyldihydropteridine diphosphokinase
MSICHIALGSNLGNRRANLTAAIELVGKLPGTRVLRLSRFVETQPVGGPSSQGPFLNAAAALETSLLPRILLDKLHDIERLLGRVRRELWGERTIDLDILLWGDARVDEPDLVIPHPAMHYRRFVLEPLVDIAADVRHPAGWTIADLWQRVNRRPYYLAITGPMGVGKTTLARELAGRLGATFIEEQFDAERLGRLYSGDRTESDPLQDGFLASRRSLLAQSRWVDQPPRWIVSDFWFAQSLAYAEVIGDATKAAAHRDAVRTAGDDVIEPTLVVWLDASPQDLAARVAGRGRDFEAAVDLNFLAALRDGYAHALTDRDAPPVHRARATTPADLVAELLVVAAAIES